MKSKRKNQIEILKKSFQENETISAKMLTNFKFYPSQISDLVKEGYLFRVERGIYQAGEKLYMEKELEPSSFSLKEDNSIPTMNFDEFEDCLYRGIYQIDPKAFPDIKKMQQAEKTSFSNYLTLLNQFIELPKVWKNYCENLRYTDLINGKQKNSLSYQVSLDIFNGNHSLAYYQLNEYYQELSPTKEDKILIQLLENVIAKIKKDQNYELLLQTEKQYDQLKEFLEECAKRRKLSSTENLSLLLIKTILKNQGKQIYTNDQTNSKTVFDAISNQDYLQAQKLHIQYLQEKGIKPEKNIITGLLDEIVTHIKSQDETENLDPLQLEENVSMPTNESAISSSKKIVPTLPSIFGFLYQGEKEKALKMTESYLLEKGKEIYFPLIKDYMELSELEKDELYQKPMKILKELDQGTYTYTLFPILLSFAESIESQKKAALYLDLAKQGEKLGVPCRFISGMEKQLYLKK